MAIKTVVKTVYGDEREIYMRLNNVEASNHGVESTALFRGFLSEQSFLDGAHFLHEETVKFNADVNENIWQQAYLEIKKLHLDVIDC